MNIEEDCFQLGIKALITDSAGKILLFERVIKGVKIWDFPGGRLKKGETPEQTLQRELAEETGLRSWSLGSLIVMDRTRFRIAVGSMDLGLIFAFYHCPLAVDEEVTLSDEHCGYGWYTPAETADLTASAYPSSLIDYLRNSSCPV